MDKNQLKELKKFFDIKFRGEFKDTNNSIVNYVAQKELSDNYYDQYFRFYRMQTTSHKLYIDLRYFKNFNEIKKSKASTLGLNLEFKGDKKFFKGIEYLSYTDINIYKVMDGFYTKREEDEFVIKNEKAPYWFSSSYAAYLNILKRGGGINSYHADKLKTMIINCNNIKKLINLTMKLKGEFHFRRNKYNKSYLLDLLRLSSCSEKGLVNQAEIWSKFNNYDNELWFTEKPRDTRVDTANYFGLTKSKGKVNYDFAYFLSYLNKKIFNNFFDGYIILEYYSPYMFNGVSSEEMVLFNPYKKIKRDTDDKYDWEKYRDYLKFEIPRNFKLPNMFSSYNLDFSLYHQYSLDYKSGENEKIMKKYKNKTKIIFLNCSNFNSVNQNDTHNENKAYLKKFMSFIKADIFVLSNCNNFSYKNPKYISQELENGKIFYKKQFTTIVSDINIVSVKNLQGINELKRISPLKFKDILKNRYQKFIKLTKEINTNIVFIPASKLQEYSDEVKYVEKMGYNFVYNNTSFLKTENLLFIKNYDVLYNECLDYSRSYFLPQLVVFDN